MRAVLKPHRLKVRHSPEGTRENKERVNLLKR